MKTYKAMFRNKYGQLANVKVIRGTKEFRTEGGISGNCVKVLFQEDPMHVYTVWEHNLI